jgi:hypothetical protein
MNHFIRFCKLVGVQILSYHVEAMDTLMGVIGEVMDVSMSMTMKVVGTLVGITPMGVFS